jgi:DNA polymerase/3'-5' exonuclease PolX
MKKLSIKRTKQLISATSKVYSRVCKEVGWSREALMMEQLTVYEQRTKGMTDERIAEIKEQIDVLYCKYLSQLDMQTLEDLLVAHRAGQIRRAARTLDIVEKELLERVLNEDKERDLS